MAATSTEINNDDDIMEENSSQVTTEPNKWGKLLLNIFKYIYLEIKFSVKFFLGLISPENSPSD